MTRIKQKFRTRTRIGRIGGRAVRLIRPYRGHPIGAVLHPPGGQGQMMVETETAVFHDEVPAVEAPEPVKEMTKAERRAAKRAQREAEQNAKKEAEDDGQPDAD